MAKCAARLLCHDGRLDPTVRATKQNMCPDHDGEDPDAGDEINKLADMLFNVAS